MPLARPELCRATNHVRMHIANGANHSGLGIRAKQVPWIGTVEMEFGIVQQVIPEALELKRGDTISLFPEHSDHLAKNRHTSVTVPSRLSSAPDQIADAGEKPFTIGKAVNDYGRQQLVRFPKG